MRSLSFRLLASFGLVILIIFGSVFFLAYQATYKEISEIADKVEVAQDQRVQSELTRYYQLNRSWQDIQSLIVQWSNLYGRRIIITDAENVVVGDSASELIGQTYVDNSSGLPLRPMMFGNRQAGTLYVMESESPDITRASLEITASSLGRYFLLGGILAVGVSILLTALLSRRILAPVRALTQAARRFGKGDLSSRVEYEGKDELGELAASFNSMASNLENLEKQRRIMVADIAHELRTPLSNLRGYLEAIADGVIQPDEANIRSLSEEANHLSRLVNELQELSLADAGALKLDIQPFDIAALLTDAVMAMQPAALSHHLTLSADIPEDLPEIPIDPYRIRQVITNLLNNAVTHTPADGLVTVTASLSQKSVIISVSDTGEGIPEEDIPYIFERFYRVDKSRNRTTGGTGLGLTIAKRLIEAHGGSISVASTFGKGTVFTVKLPLFREE